VLRGLSRVLYPGRFQPFHLGHLRVIEDLFGRFDEVVILIGSAQEGFTCRNPFTAGERLEMIRSVLRSRGFPSDRYWLIPVPDIHMPPAWTSYVLSIVPRIDVVASGNPHVIRLFEWIGYSVYRVKLFEPEKYNGTRIRRLMSIGSDEWRSLVPGEVASFIDRLGGVDRVREVCGGSGC
jgi:nicotinamide-nucleotide adenylyltransferase